METVWAETIKAIIDHWMESGMGPYITLFLVLDLAAQAALTAAFGWRNRNVADDED